jgi:hypothetical protein
MITTVLDLLYMNIVAEKKPIAVLSEEEIVAESCIDILSDNSDTEPDSS